jgi:hypothetical protein
MDREYKTLTALRRGEVVDLGGIKFKMVSDYRGIKVGDLYIGERNTGAHLLEAAKIDEEHCIIHPTQPQNGPLNYPYDSGECVKVEEV